MDSTGTLRIPDDFLLDIQAQRPRINRLYTQLTFCFKLSNDTPSLQSETISALNEGVKRLTASFPWVAGKVVSENGTFKIKPSRLPLVVKDFRNYPSLPSWDTLQQANFPFAMLRESDIASCTTLATSDASTAELPVFMIQANFVTGGLLLTFTGQHGSMDMAGQSQVIYLFAKACRNEPFTPSELSVGNMDRRNAMPPLDDYVPEPAPPDQNPKPTPERAKHPSHLSIPPLNPIWAYFNFPAPSLSLLKSLATNAIPPHIFVSTDDVLSAFTWQSISRARLPRLDLSLNLSSTLSRNVDLRRFIPLPPTYPGFVVGSTANTCSVDGLVKQPLGIVASWLRGALGVEVLERELRGREARNQVGGGASNPELDVRLSSWAKERCYDVDFGIGSSGKADVVRRPAFTEGAREGLVYFLPKTRDGEIMVGVCLREEDLERLKEDGDFGRFGSYVR